MRLAGINAGKQPVSRSEAYDTAYRICKADGFTKEVIHRICRFTTTTRNLRQTYNDAEEGSSSVRIQLMHK
ncbi:MAG: hypothetical protein CL587_13750 [Alteromonadaceae bacterium]|nr:hypothetical protein [Alteromonadaceae bacterium]